MELLLPAFVLGLVTSLHCVSMCGPMVVTYALSGTGEATVAGRVAPNLAYQAARIVSYMVFGLVLGAIGSAFDLAPVRPYVMAGAGAFMIVIALGMTGRAPWALRLMPRPPRFLVRALSATRRRALEDASGDRGASLATPVTFGLLTGLMPCAPLMAAQLSAAASGSALSGALFMLAFGLGTAPALFAFGAASSFVPARLKQKVTLLLAVVVLVFGVTYVNRGATLLGSPVTLQAARDAVFGTADDVTAGGYAIGADGVAEVPLVIQDTRFSPATITVPADVPVRLVVDRRESNACSDQLALPQLGVLADLAPDGVTVVDLPATAEGSYTLTCGMGMMSGRLVAGGDIQPADAPASPACAGCSNATTGATGESAEGAATLEGGVQRISVDATNGYDPNVIRLTAGVPAEITFSQASGCMAEVMSEDLGFYADLRGGPQTVRIEADVLQPGEYSFSCGMRMVFGTIIVE